MTTDRSPWRSLQGPNLAYALERYDIWREHPDQVDAATARRFEAWGPPPSEVIADADFAPTAGSDAKAVAGAVAYARSIRDYGHLAAALDPLGSDPPGDPSLELEAHGLDAETLRRLPAALVEGPCADEAEDALEATQALMGAYSEHIGHDHRQIRVPEERRWLADAAESGRFAPGGTGELDGERATDWRLATLRRLTEVEVFEQFLHRVFPGRHRFSIEGVDILVPMLEELVRLTADTSTREIMLGMAHRGRLSVMIHVLRRPYGEIMIEFRDPMRAWRVGAREDLGWTGDVKYHQGACKRVTNDERPDLSINLLPNPSHLEFVNPVVQGMARAAGEAVDAPGRPKFDPHRSLPVAIHGDASFPAQGVVAETLNLSRIPGYHTGGTIHIIANNQIGFTTDPMEGRSTLFASDLAKGFRMPIFHVNADDPHACLEVIRIAWAYRERFAKDVLIDLIGYRRHGHNEGDEPRFTQPLLYDRIEDHPTVRELWARRLVEDGVVSEDDVQRMEREHFRTLQETLETLDADETMLEDNLPSSGRPPIPDTTVPLERLREFNRALIEFPEGFSAHRKIRRARERRADVLDEPDEPTVDWATAEELALASVLADGTALRLTGEDTERGTFSQRHAVLHDMKSGENFAPLQTFEQARAACEILNSPLSEVAAIGFEYGYNIQAPERLVIWEAQYGDFANVAQVMFDEFLLSGRAKWGQTPSLVLLLPHGHEGAGPDHSSARPERFLQLAAERNVRLTYPSTAAQYFHLLRRHTAALVDEPMPLVVLTPKSLLRADAIRCAPRDLAEGGWRCVIDDPRTTDKRKRRNVGRLVICSGKIWFDLVTDDRWEPDGDVAVARLEQLVPFPEAELEELLDAWPRLTEVAWVQEEPSNMGFWSFLRPRLQRVIDGRFPLRYIGRPRSSSPAEGISAWHKSNQQDLIRHALDPESRREEGELVSHQTA